MVLQLHMSTTQQKAPVHNMDQNGSNNSQRIPNVNPSPRISRLADKLQSKVCSFPAKELQVLGRDGPFHRERTEPLGTTQVPCITMIALSLLTAAPQQFDVLHLSSTAALISWHACSLQHHMDLQVGKQQMQLVDTPEGAEMRDCAFRAHDPRFCSIIGETPQIFRIAHKDYDFAHEVRPRCLHAAEKPHTCVACPILIPGEAAVLCVLQWSLAAWTSLTHVGLVSMAGTCSIYLSTTRGEGYCCRGRCGCQSCTGCSLSQIGWAIRRQQISGQSSGRLILRHWRRKRLCPASPSSQPMALPIGRPARCS